MNKKKFNFVIKAKGSLVGSKKKYIYLKKNKKIHEFFRKQDATKHVRRLRKAMLNMNKTLPPSQHKTLWVRYEKIKR